VQTSRAFAEQVIKHAWRPHSLRLLDTAVTLIEQSQTIMNHYSVHSRDNKGVGTDHTGNSS